MCDLVKVDFYGDFCADANYAITLAGATSTGNGAGAGCAYVKSSLASARLKPNTAYTMSSSCAKALTAHIRLSVPGCYKVFIDGKETSTIDITQNACTDNFTGTWTVILKPSSGSGGPGTAGNGDGGLRSVHWSFSLGGLADGSSAGAILIAEPLIVAGSYTPSALLYESTTPEVQVIRDAGALRQVKAPEVLADVVTINAQKYEIRYYTAANAGSFSSGLWHPVNTPFAIWTVENPVATPGSQLRITLSRDGTSTAHDFTFNATTGAWSLNDGDLRLETRSQVVLGNGDERITVTISNPATGLTSTKRRETRHMFAWGEEVIHTIDDPDGSALTTSYTYYDEPMESGSYGKQKWVIRPDGSWEKSEYESDGSISGNLAAVYRPWKGSPASPDLADFTNCLVSKYYYGSADSHFATVLLHEYRYINGDQVGSRLGSLYTLDSNVVPGNPVEYRSQILNDGWFNAIEQSSETRTYTSSASLLYRGRPESVLFSDGRLDSYTYALGTYAAGSFTAGAGSDFRQILTRGTADFPDGIANRTTRSVTIRDSAGRVRSEEEQVYTGAGYETLTANTSLYDSKGRPFQEYRNGVLLREFSYPAARQVVETDEQGMSTTTASDALGRVATESRAGIATTHAYDGDGHSLTTTRIGGGLTLASSASYDLAGRLLTQTGEDGLTTFMAYTLGGRTETRTLPGGGTEVTERFLDGQPKSITGTAVVARYFDYNYDATTFLSETQESLGAVNSPRWTKTSRNFAGHTVQTEAPAFAGTLLTGFTYDLSGRLLSKTVPGTMPELWEYDPLGQPFRTGRDTDADGILQPASTDRFQQSAMSYEKAGNDWYRVTSLSRYETGDDATPTVLHTAKELLSLSGNVLARSLGIDRYGQTTTRTVTVNRTTQTLTETMDTPDSALDAVSISTNGRLVSASTPTVPQPVTYEYDGLGRLKKVTDPRGIETVTTYNGSQVASVTVAGQTTGYQYYPTGQAGAGQVKLITQPDAKTIFHSYTLRGELTRTWGSATYPSETIFDSFGQQPFLRTYRGGTGWEGATFPTGTGTADTTTWDWQESTGLLLSKTDALNKATNYTYTALGQPLTRTWARGVVTTYHFTALGDLEWIHYSDTTPAVTYGYDRAGRVNAITDAAGQHTIATTNASQSDSITGGLLDGLSITAGFDGFGRRSDITATLGAWTQGTAYHYDGADTTGRLARVTSGSEQAAYGYLVNSDLLQTTTFTRTGTTRLAATRGWDAANRLKSMTNTWNTGARSLDTTLFDAMNRRKTVQWQDGSSWGYGYNDRGEVIAGGRTWSDAAPVNGQQYAYSFDSIGNRTGTVVNGRTASYGADAGNRLTTRDVPGAVDVLGTASPQATVSVNGAAAARHGDYFYRELPVTNGSGPTEALPTIAATRASGTTTRTGRVFVPRTPEAYSYDFDGNQQADGRATYTWDAENRLIGIETLATVPVGSRVKLALSYDARHRRIRKQVWRWTAGAWALHHTIRFACDGWNLIAELGDAGQPLRTYAWGLDLSGTLQGAGGVGGLLFVQDATEGRTFSAAYDLNGNLIALVDQGTGATAVQYEYGPFGELIRESGQYAPVNPFRLSTKYQDDETGLLYYGYRYYNPSTGRWLSRDPIGELGGVNLYGMLGNSPVNHWDYLGLMDYPFKNLGDLSGGGTDPANDAAKDAISGFIHGSLDSNREYGPDHAWTAEMKKHEHMKTIRNEIRGKIRAYCGGQNTGTIGVVVLRPFSLNEQSLLTNARIFISDVLAGIGVARSVHSTGSVQFKYTITSIDCTKCVAKSAMDARDTLSIGSVTRIPKTNLSLLDVWMKMIGSFGPPASPGGPPSIPFDGNPNKWNNAKPNSPGNNINLHWYWNETVEPQ